MTLKSTIINRDSFDKYNTQMEIPAHQPSVYNSLIDRMQKLHKIINMHKMIAIFKTRIWQIPRLQQTRGIQWISSLIWFYFNSFFYLRPCC